MRGAWVVFVVACGREAPTPAVVVTPSTAPADAAPRLRKADIRAAIKAVVPRLDECYTAARKRDPQISGVINTKLTVTSDTSGVSLRVDGFETAGTLGTSPEMLACVTRTFESSTHAPIATTGRVAITYPATFAPAPPDERDIHVVDRAERALAERRFGDAFAEAERGLALTSLDGPYRRRLVEVGGRAACELGNEARARYYFSLASTEVEERLLASCTAIDLLR